MPAIPATLPDRYRPSTPEAVVVTARAGINTAAGNHFPSPYARLGFDRPDWFVPRRETVLSGLEAASRLTPSQVRTIVRAQYPRMTIRQHGREVSFGGELKAALACLREEARSHGRLVALGQAWAASNQLVAALTVGQRLLVTRVMAGAVAGEIVCRVLDDLGERRVVADADVELLRQAWRAAHPPPVYLRTRGPR